MWHWTQVLVICRSACGVNGSLSVAVLLLRLGSARPLGGVHTQGDRVDEGSRMNEVMSEVVLSPGMKGFPHGQKAVRLDDVATKGWNNLHYGTLKNILIAFEVR